MAGSLMRTWWGRLSAEQRADLRLAAAEYRLQDGASCQVLADTGCPVYSTEPEARLDDEPGQVWVLPEFLRTFIIEQHD